MLISYVRRNWKAEPTRHVLWLAVAFLAGTASYFLLPSEPPAYAFGAVAALVAPWLYTLRRRSDWQFFWLALLLFGVGAGWAKFCTDYKPITLQRESLTPRPVSGMIEEIEYLPTGVRLTLSGVSIAGMLPNQTPERVRLGIRAKKLPPLEVGMQVELNAGLLPPMGPVLPNSFDFSRYFFFRDLGAVGFGLPPIRVRAPPAETQNFMRYWHTKRQHLAENIRSHLAPTTAAVATGLITGDDAGIPEAVQEQLRASNLLHIIAISGTHMVLIAGVAFFTLRMLFLPLPFLGLRPRAKQWAAAGTLVAISAYLCITGFEISALRAYVMMVLILLSVLLLREVDAMRSLALAACIMLLLDPSDILEPGFQLSFIATMAMIAAVEKHLNRPLHQTAGNLWKFPLAALGTFLLFSISAELATAPLVASMFNQFSLYGMLANFLAGPLVSFLIMPAVALYFVSYPFGLEAPVLSLLGLGIDWLLALAAWVASLPYALHYVVAHPAWGVVLYVAGVLWLCLWQGRWRWWGVLLALIGALSFLTVRAPDAVISNDMKTIAIRHEGEMYLLRGRPTAMVPSIIANGVGEVSLQPPKAITFMQCEGALCTYRASSMTLLVANTPMLYSDVCTQAKAVKADVVVSVNRMLYCPQLAPVLDGRARTRNGAHALWRTTEGLRVETTRQWQGNRPWASQ